MDNKKFKIRCDHSTIIESLLDAIKEIGYVLQHTPVVTLESKNLFGDIQLHLDV